MILRTEDLRKDFGGVTAVRNVDFELEDGELCSLIGPNGAGKTTFFNLLTGTLPASSGKIELKRNGSWVDITDREPYETAVLGIHRSYQITNIFPNNTVLENVRIAAQAHGNDSFKMWKNVKSFDEYYEEARSILERINLEDRAMSLAQNLSHGQKRQLEVGIALAGDPDVLLLDEPNAGVSSEGIDMIIDLIEDVSEDHTVLLVEHNMDIVMNVSERVVVLNQGELIADGTPEEVRNDPKVQKAYLGGYERGVLNKEARDEKGSGDQDVNGDENGNGDSSGDTDGGVTG